MKIKELFRHELKYVNGEPEKALADFKHFSIQLISMRQMVVIPLESLF